jgi:DNA-binding NarL/FixJ family response regulator
MIQVLIADDHAVVREGIKRIIADTPDVRVAGEAADGQQLLDMVAKGGWDVVLMDLSMPGPSGLDLLKGIRQRAPQLPLLVLTMYPEDQYAVRTLKAGASGYIHKGSPPGEMVEAIRAVSAGRKYISPAVAQCLANHVGEGVEELPHSKLSNREHEVFCLIASGKTVTEIASALALSVKTVSTFRRRVLEKLGLRHNADLTRYAMRHGLIE